MKKLIMFISLFMFVGSVSAKEITLDDMVKVINEGEITKEFVKNEKSIKDDKGKKKYDDVVLNATKTDNGIQIMYSYFGEENVVGQVNATLVEEGKILRSVISYHEDDEYIPETEIKVHNLLVYWAIETSDSFKEVKEYVDEAYIVTFDEYFNKCYRKEMHACRTYVETQGNYEYTSDVELNDEATKYLITELKETARKDKNRKILFAVAGVAAVLGVLFIIAKSCEDKPKPIKY